MKDTISDVVGAIRPDLFSWAGAVIGMAVAWFTGLSALAQALLIVQAADVLTGILCALGGKSDKSASGKISSSALAMGVVKKGLEWLVVLICARVGAAIGFETVSGVGIGGAAMTYMMATELVSLIENLSLFGLDVPLLKKLLDVAHGTENDEDKTE